MTVGNFDEETLKAINEFKASSPVVSGANDNGFAATNEESSAVEESDSIMDNGFGEPNSSTEQTLNDQQIQGAEESVGDKQDSDVGDSQSPSEDIEWVKADGKKIKVDYNDRERIKKVHQMAAGMRKFQSERDALVIERDDWKSKYEDVYNNVIKPCDEALENDDIDTVFRLITGGKELNDLVEERGKERETLAKMTPQQLDAYNNQKQIEKRLMDLERREKLLQKREEETNAKLDTSDKHRQEAMVTPVFEKYRFAGKFGNADKEYMADSMLWNAAITELSQYESVDRELIDKVFKKQSSVFSGLINAQANKKVDSKIKKQKQEVKREVQKEIFQNNNNRKQDIEQQVKDGNYRDAIAEIFSGNSIF